MSNSKIEFIETRELKVYEKNNKKHPKKQIEAIAESIKRLGFINPILIDENNVIVAGHGRLKAIDHLRGLEGDSVKTGTGEDLDLTKAKVMRVSNLSQNELRAYRIFDNKSAELAEWDWENLKIDFDNIKLEGLDEITGFTDDDFKFLEKTSEIKEPSDTKQRLKHVAECPSCGHEFKLKAEKVD